MKYPAIFGGMDEAGRKGHQPMTVQAIEVDVLKALLDDPKSSILLIDCRPFLSYNSGHIRAALNVYCPPILRRRYGQNVPLDIILGSTDSRKDLIEGQYGLIVVYDDSTFSEDGLIVEDFAPVSTAKANTSSHNLFLVLHSLACDLSDRVGDMSLRYLNGGFDHFAKVCQHLVRSKVITRPSTVPVTLPNEAGSDLNSVGRSNHIHCGPNCNKLGLIRKISQSEHIIGNSSDTVKCHSSNDKGDPVEILPWLYLGNAYHAAQETSLKRLGIFALLNVAEMSDADDAMAPASSSSFCHMNLPIADNATSDISCNFPQAIEFIESVRLSGGKVLVHCLAGISRSPTICIAYLMYSRHLSLDQAHDFIKQRRALISPNLNFMRQLSEYERLLAPQQMANFTTDCGSCDWPLQSVSVARTGLPHLSTCSSLLQPGKTDDRKPNGGSAAVSRKRPRPDSLSFSIPCSGKPLKSVPYTPCTKQAIFTFDFPSVTVLTSSPTVSHSPLLSPS